MEDKKELIKKLRRLEIRNLISDIRYLLNFIIKYGHDKNIDDIVSDYRNDLTKMFKVRNDFDFLRIAND